MSELKFVKGNLFDTKYEAIVCPVNSVGVMGAGLAKEFANRFDCKTYFQACARGEVAPGTVLVRQPAHAYSDTNKTIIFLATKADWRNESQPDWIMLGLENLFKALKYYNINTVAIPALGAGLGKLNWLQVKSIIEMVNNKYNDGSQFLEVYEPL
jgi:O-acetyl-ADP-ribose deacetylase (regulator of RNase III)